MSGLIKTPGLVEELHNFAIIKKKPFLGICVGMQMLANESEENGTHKGLGWIDGNIKAIPSKNLKMPHMGWNVVSPKKPTKNGPIQKSNRSRPSNVPPGTRYFLSKLSNAIS